MLDDADDARHIEFDPPDPDLTYPTISRGVRDVQRRAGVVRVGSGLDRGVE
jgi:hypothetical protein